jgi:hypothetical protein
MFFVSVASKGFGAALSCLESTVTEQFASADGSVDILLFVEQLKRDPSTARPDAEIDTARFPRKERRDASLRMTQ